MILQIAWIQKHEKGTEGYTAVFNTNHPAGGEESGSNASIWMEERERSGEREGGRERDPETERERKRGEGAEGESERGREGEREMPRCP